MFIIAFFKLLARDFLELNFVMVAIEREALLLNLDSILSSGELLDVANLLRLKFPGFSITIDFRALGILFFSHLQIILDSATASSSSNFKILFFFRRFRVCCLKGLIYFQDFLMALINGFSFDGLAPPHTVRQYKI